MRVRMLAGSALLALVVALLTPVAAFAQATTTTNHFSFSFSHPDINPCTGAPGTLTENLKGVIHITELASGKVHEAATVTETFTFVPDDPSQPTFTGKATFRNGANFNTKTFTATFTGHIMARGSDGSRIAAHSVAHITVHLRGTVSAEFFKDRLSCR
jgi:hypothetical protein